MSRTCQVCGRGTRASQSRSHSNIATKRTQKINVQNKNINGEKVKVCAKCIKTAIKRGKEISA
ncbi:MAG: 50S ribosomal protein L28 [Candidatus Pacebacteria bacterium]|nr:50S ribosomal protein L28 [Candidatus Paceibacterota bacterium]